VGKPEADRKGIINQMVALENLSGIDRVSHQTKIPGIYPYDKNSGRKGYEEWLATLFKNLEAVQKTGILPFTDEQLTDIVGGFLKGYPDIAIYDATEWYATDRTKPMQDSQIPGTKLYDEAEPNYDFYPEHAEDPNILNDIKNAGKILEQFYKSEWHKRVSPEPVSHLKAKSD